MLPISVLLAWAYPVHPYIRRHPNAGDLDTADAVAPFIPSYQGGLLGLRAFLGMINPVETIEGIVWAGKLFATNSDAISRRPEPVAENWTHDEFDEQYPMYRR